MQQVKLKRLTKARYATEEFGGYDHRPVISAGAWYNECNLSRDKYPLATIRKNRQVATDVNGISYRDVLAFCGKEQLVVLDSDGVVHAGGHTLWLLEGELTAEITYIRGVFTAEIDSKVEFLDTLGIREPSTVTLEYISSGTSGWWEYEQSRYDADDIGISISGQVQEHNLITVHVGCNIGAGMAQNDENEGSGFLRSLRSVEMTGSGTECAPSMVSMGAYVVVFPYKMFFNAVKLAAGQTLVEGTDYGGLEQHYRLIADDELGDDSEDFPRVKLLGLDVPTRKYISKIILRYARELGASVQVYVQYDESGRWILKEELVGTKLYSGTVAIWPRRCDTFRLRLEGVGGFTLYSISYERERGSDL